MWVCLCHIGSPAFWDCVLVKEAAFCQIRENIDISIALVHSGTAVDMVTIDLVQMTNPCCGHELHESGYRFL